MGCNWLVYETCGLRTVRLTPSPIPHECVCTRQVDPHGAAVLRHEQLPAVRGQAHPGAALRQAAGAAVRRASGGRRRRCFVPVTRGHLLSEQKPWTSERQAASV